MNPAEVSAVLVTRGDVNMEQIFDSIDAAGITDVVVYNNLLEEDLGVYGRYAGVDQAKNEICFVQDDDCLVPIARLLDVAGQYDLREKIVANMPVSRWDDYPDSALIGWGAVFHRDLPQRAISRFLDGMRYKWRPEDEDALWHRECDTVFTTLTPCVKVDLGFEHLPWAEDPERALFKQPGHREARDRMLALARKVRDS